MAPTPNRPPLAGGAGASPAGSPVRPPTASKTSMSSILSNVDGLFQTARQGRLNANSITYLRAAIRDHYTYVIYYAIKSGKPNPLLDTPAGLDPSIGSGSQGPLVDPITWQSMITSAEVEARRKNAEGILVIPTLSAPPPSASGTSTPVSSPGAGNVGSMGRPPQLNSVRPPQRGPHVSSTPSATGSTTAVGTPAASTSSQMSAPMRNMLPGTLMKGDELRRWASMPSAERAEAMRTEPELKRRFEASVQFYRAQSRAKEIATANAAAQAQAAGGMQGKAEGSSAGPGQQQSNMGQSAPNQNPNPNPNGPNVILGNPNFTLSQPPSRNPHSGQPQSTNNAGQSVMSHHPTSNQNPTSTQNQNQGQGQNQNLDPSLSYSIPAHLQPHPQNQNQNQNQNHGQNLGPPPPPVRRVIEEPEGDRRKRKYGEWVGEIGAGIEVELGLEEIINDVVEKFINDMTRSGAKLARHRKSEKIEIKDMALHLDKRYHLTVPGFDAVLPQRTHIPPDDEERKRLRAVIPRSVLTRPAEGTAATTKDGVAATAPAET